jgi:hypothetical protein
MDACADFLADELEYRDPVAVHRQKACEEQVETAFYFTGT